MAAEEGLMGQLEKLGSVLGMGKQLKDFFDGGELSLKDIRKAVREEVQQVFFASQVEQALIEASAKLQTARDFLNDIYIDAQEKFGRGEYTAQDLWGKLDSGDNVRVSELTESAKVIEGWINAADERGEAKSLGQATSIYLGLYLMICLQHRERAALAAKPAERDNQHVALVNAADKAMRTMQARTMRVIESRIGALALNRILISPVAPIPAHRLDDGWVESGPRSLVAVGKSEENDIGRVWHAYRRLLWSGSDADHDELKAAIAASSFGYGNYANWRDEFAALGLPRVRKFGQWAADARSLLMSLNALAVDLPKEGAMQDNWHFCKRCSGLYWGSGVTACPVGGAHQFEAAGDYAVYVGAAPARALAQGSWRWCSKCAGLHYSEGASVCPADKGRHETAGSGAYILLQYPVPRGIGYQGFWRWCRKCGGLHFPPFGGNQCPAGGAHDATGSAEYFIGQLGGWPSP